MSKSLALLFSFMVAASARAQEPRVLTPALNQVAAVNEGGVLGVSESPDGRFMLLMSPAPESANEMQWLLHDRTTGRTRRIHVGAGMEAEWSPQGNAIAFSRADDQSEYNFIWTQRINPRTGELQGLPRRVSVSPGRGPSWSPDGRSIAFVALPATDTVAPRIIVVPSAGGPERVVVRSTGFAQQLTWAPDGRSIFYRTRLVTGGPVTLSRVDLRDNSVQVLKRVRDVLRGIGSGRYLAYSVFGGAAAVGIATLDGVELGQLPITGGITPQRWSVRGLSLLAVQNHAPTQIMLAPVAGGPARTVSRPRTFDYAPAFSPDSRQLALGSKLGNRNQLFVQPVNGPRRHIPTRAAPEQALTWSPDQRYVAFLSNGLTQLNVVELASGAEQALLRGEKLAALRWRRDGRALQVAVGSQNRTELREVSLGGASTLLRTIGQPLNRLQLTFATDTTVVFGDDKVLRTIHLRDGRERLLVAADDPASGGWNGMGAGIGVAVSHDGGFAIITEGGPDPQRADRFSLSVIDLQSGTRRRVTYEGMMLGGGPFVWHPDGRAVVHSAQPRDGFGEVPVLLPLNGDPPRYLADPAKIIDLGDFDVSPDGSTIVYAAHATGFADLWDIDLARALARFQAGSNR